MNIDISQAPALGSAANFALFSTNGAVSNAGLSQLIGNVEMVLLALANFSLQGLIY